MNLVLINSSCKEDYEYAIYLIQPMGPWAAMGEKVVKIINSGKHYSYCSCKQSAYWQVCYRRPEANS